eukprot:scaffold10432_cov130-Isochrysis_galbana.AAC.4
MVLWVMVTGRQPVGIALSNTPFKNKGPRLVLSLEQLGSSVVGSSLRCVYREGRGSDDWPCA